MSDAAHEVCEFLVGHLQRKVGVRWRQGEARIATTRTEPAICNVARYRLFRVPEVVRAGLIRATEGERPLHVFRRIATAEEVLSLQARGERCISLLEEGAPTAPHEDVLAFAVHDLCHLEKFVDPDTYAEQVGFFAAVECASRSAGWRELSGPLDDTWRKDFESVVCDMNGSCIFLLAATKMKLKMAVRRQLGGTQRGGPLDERELAAYARAEEHLFDLLRLSGDIRDSARRVSARRDAQHDALRVRDYFQAMGLRRLPHLPEATSGVGALFSEACD